MARQARKTKKLEMWAKMTQRGLTIPSPNNRTRIMLEAQKMPPEGKNVKLIIAFQAEAKSAEMMGLYFGGLLPLWIAHNRDLIKQDTLKKEPLYLRELCRKHIIKKVEVNDAHDDFMKEFRHSLHKNYITGNMEKGRQSLSDMNSYEAALYITEICQYLEENTGIILNTEEFKRARDMVELIVQEGPRAVKKAYFEPEETELGDPHTAFD